MAGQFQGKIALVTGGGSDIGRVSRWLLPEKVPRSWLLMWLLKAVRERRS
jgi:hypothetical protein